MPARYSVSPKSRYDLWSSHIEEVFGLYMSARGPIQKQPIIYSGYTNLCSEKRALNVVNIDPQIAWVSDPKLQSCNLLMSNDVGHQHHFRDQGEVSQSGRGYCFIHKGFCEARPIHVGDQPSSVVHCFPCQAFSTAREKRHEGPEEHQDANEWSNAIDELLRTDADELWCENIMGMAPRESRDKSHSPLQVMLQDVAR